MSLRWHLIGLDLAPLWRRIGSRDNAALGRLKAQLDARVKESIEEGGFDAGDATEYRVCVWDILDRAISGGAPFKDLDAESGFHVDAADAMARFGQTPCETESWDWKHGAWFELEKQIAGRLSPTDRQLLAWLVHGRPIFGKCFDTGWEFYTYLTKDEAIALAAGIEAAVAAPPAVSPIGGSRNFASELVGWLRDIAGRGLDVWVRAE